MWGTDSLKRFDAKLNQRLAGTYPVHINSKAGDSHDIRFKPGKTAFD